MANPLRQKLRDILTGPLAERKDSMADLRVWVRGRRRADLLRWMKGLSVDEWRMLWGCGLQRSIWFDAQCLYARAKAAQHRSAGGHSWLE